MDKDILVKEAKSISPDVSALQEANMLSSLLLVFSSSSLLSLVSPPSSLPGSVSQQLESGQQESSLALHSGERETVAEKIHFSILGNPGVPK